MTDGDSNDYYNEDPNLKMMIREIEDSIAITECIINDIKQTAGPWWIKLRDSEEKRRLQAEQTELEYLKKKLYYLIERSNELRSIRYPKDKLGYTRKGESLEDLT